MRTSSTPAEVGEPAAQLDARECWAALRTADVGRLALVVDGRPEIFPVNFVVDHGTILFRTATGSKLAAIAPFVVVSSGGGPGLAATGRVRFRTIYTGGESRVPPMALEGRVTMFHNLTVGADLLLTRNSLGDVRYDTGRDALSADGRAERLVLPKVYAMWKTPSFQAIAGSYVAGFAQRLTFDETILVTPNGIFAGRYHLITITARQEA